MCSCLRALKTSLTAEFWTFWSLSRCFGERVEENYSSQVLTKKVIRSDHDMYLWRSLCTLYLFEC